MKKKTSRGNKETGAGPSHLFKQLEKKSGENIRNEFKCKIQSGALDSPGAAGLFQTDNGLMVRDLYCRGGTAASTTQYVLQRGGQRVRVTFMWWVGLGRAPDSRPLERQME